MAVMDDTPLDRLAPAAPQPSPDHPDHDASGERNGAASTDRFGDALAALAAADPAQAPDLADAIAERLGAALAEEDDGADTPQA